ncbi:MAG: alpha-2-macroglobulin family protein [Planctomycetota bacterium]|nr:alpha-2-macroglobulin family protein [Planctomycetota bacterium]
MADQPVHARVRIRDRKGRGFWRQIQGTTGSDGLVHLVSPQTHDYREAFVSVRTSKGSAFAVLSQQDFRPDEAWRIHVVTDRPAYRPDQTVSWKLSARRHTGLQYSTPAGQELIAKLIGPRGEEIDSAEVKLNDFGSAFGSFETGESMALGQYSLQLIDPLGPDGSHQIAYAALFRLEEYKRPEFEVTVRTPMDHSGPGKEPRPKVFVLGDEVQAEVQATTYFGSPVVGAKVQVILYRESYSPVAMHRARFQWFSDSLVPEWQRNRYNRYNSREEVRRRDLNTYEEGLARLTFPTPFGQGQAYKSTVEARVTDASRREVTGTGQVVVERQSYRVELDLEHTITTPGGQAELSVLAQDSNGHPVEVEGQMFLYRARWVEVWAGPDNAPIPHNVLRKARQASTFPMPGWTQVRAEYVFEPVDAIRLATDARGRATWSPTLPKEGVYKFAWISEDPRSSEVHAETWMFAADGTSLELAYNREGLQILLDKSAIAEGQTVQVLVLTDASDRHVLFTVESETLMSIDVLHMEGTVKLVSIPLDVTHVPNVFLTATEVRNGKLRRAQERLVVPPAQHFLDMDVTLDKESYRPGSTGTFQVKVLDSNGEPVKAEVSLSLYDGSLLGVAQDLIPDPREFFWGHDRRQRVTHTSCFDQLSYIRLVADDQGRLMTPGEKLQRDGRMRFYDDGVEGAYDMALAAPSQTASRSQSLSMGKRSAPGSELKRAKENSDWGAPAGAPMELGLLSESASPSEPSPGEDKPTGDGSSITVRADFRETALWLPSVVTDDNGQAHGEFTLPDSTTRWQVSSFANDGVDRFGSHREQGAITELPLILRPQMPRFLVEGDRARVTAMLTNTTDAPLETQVEFATEGLEILGHFQGGTLVPGHSSALTVAAHSDARLDFLVQPNAIGTANLRLTARSSEASDAVLRTLPVIEHGIEALVSDSGRMDGDVLEHDFVLPPAKDGRTTMQIAVAPSLATTMLDALPYLTHYPYGCLEQSLSRFVPTAVAARTMEELGLEPAFVARASFGGINADWANKTQKLGSKDFEHFTKAAEAGLEKIEGLQKGDGSWSWWPGGPSNQWMTAYAAWSLALAKDAKLQVSNPVLDQAMIWLENALVEESSDVNMKAWMLHALCEVRRVQQPSDPSKNSAATFAALYAKRTGLSPYGRALLTLCAKSLGKDDEARVLVDNLANGVIRGDASSSQITNASGGKSLETAHWGSQGIYRHWSQGAVESTAFTLRALLAVDPTHELVQPTMTWLVNNRRGAQWGSTRDTAICVLALCDYLKSSGETTGSASYEVWVDGKRLISRFQTGQSMLLAQDPIEVSNARSGAHRVRIVRKGGKGPLYWTVSARFFSAEEPIQARASEVFVRRQYYRLVPHDTLLKGKVFERVLLQDGDAVQSGERIEVVLTLDATNDLEYMMIRDAKPAGLQATVLQSGGGKRARQLRADEAKKRFGEGSGELPNRRATGDAVLEDQAGYTGSSQWLYHELRDEAQVYFADKLPRGLWEIRSTLRADVPGTFHALPAVASAMYVPEIQGNSAEVRVQVNDD